MKTKTKIILKSLADLPANTLALAAFVPQQAFAITKRALTPSVRATRKQIRAARQRSANFMRDLAAQAAAPLQTTNYWLHGGLND